MFVGLDGTPEELDLPKKHFWVFTMPQLHQEASGKPEEEQVGSSEQGNTPAVHIVPLRQGGHG